MNGRNNGVRRIAGGLIALSLIVFAFVAACVPGEAAPPAGEAVRGDGSSGGSEAFATGQRRIALITGPEESCPEEYARAALMASGGAELPSGVVVLHVAIPAADWKKPAAVADAIAGAAATMAPDAIVMTQSVRGSAAGFSVARQEHPEIVLVAVEPVEDPLIIQQSVALAVNIDYVSRPYALLQAARKLGALSIVYVVNPALEGYEPFDRRRLVLEHSANEAGLPYAEIRYKPDAKMKENPDGFFARVLPETLADLPSPAYVVCDRGIPFAPLAMRVSYGAGIILEEDVPSLSAALFEAFALDPALRGGDGAIKRLEKAVIDRNAVGRFALWTKSWGASSVDAVVDHLALVFGRKHVIDRLDDLMSSFSGTNSGSVWRGTYYIDPFTGVEARSHVLVYQDPYVLGRGYLAVTKYEIPKSLWTLLPKEEE